MHARKEDFVFATHPSKRNRIAASKEDLTSKLRGEPTQAKEEQDSYSTLH